MGKLVAAGAAVAAAAVLLVGGAVLATRDNPGGDGGGDRDVAATADTVVVTTTTAEPGVAAGPPTTDPGHEHGPGDDGMPHEEPSPAPPSLRLTCAPGFGAGPGPTVAAPPDESDQAVSLGPPGEECHETVTGCVVGVSLRWSDGHVERASRAIDATGRYTLEGDRGTVADFVVDATQTCPTPSLTYRTTWPRP